MRQKIGSVAAMLVLAGCSSEPVSRLSPEERQQVIAMGQEIDSSMLPAGVRTEVGSVKDVRVPWASGTVLCRVYRPVKPASAGTVLLVHGGAWIAGSVDSHDNMARLICSVSQANVVSVDYSRSPGAMYPTQLEQIRAVLGWVGGEGRREGLASRPLAICGDSAGGNMSAVISREYGSNAVALAVLINPVVDTSLRTIKDPEVRGFSEIMLKAYVPQNVDVSGPRIAPLLHPVPEDHPPTFIAIGDTDPWRAEQDLYAEMLRVAGVKVQVFRAATGHLGPDGAAASPVAVPTLKAAAQAIAAAFAGR